MTEEPIKIVDATPGADIRGERVLRALERPFVAVDRFLERTIPPNMNPFAQTGAIANLSFAIAVVTGVLLLFWYVPSVNEAWDSLENLGAVGQFVRSMHRYSSDACIFFVVIHALKLFSARRFGGPRWVAWVTGLILVALLWFVGWIGYWLVWDVRAQAVAVGTARFVEVIPIFTDPLSRTFLTNDSVSTPLFFTVFFFHMLIPLAMGIVLWMHISRVARAKFLTSRAMTAWVVGTMIVASIVVPATSAAPADMAQKLPAFTMDWWYLLPIVLTERLGAGALWAVALLAGIALYAIPWALTRKRALVAMVDLKRCNGCSRCADDCPYDAIVMVERDDGHQRWELQAEVEPNKCVGCGICAGSCNPGGIGLPDMPVQDKRKIVDRWIDEALERGDDPYIAFLCANSAGGDFFVQGDGTCRELPGYHCIGVPCSGWVHAMSVERALRRGAAGIVIVGCGCSDPPFREGPKWTDERIGARREPALRLEKIDPYRVRFFKLTRGSEDELVRRALAFAAGDDDGEDRGSGRKAIAIGAAVAAIITAVIVGGSVLPSTLTADPSPELVVTLKHRPSDVQDCRPATEAEKARMQKHMMREEICERTRPDVRLEIVVDGELMHRENYPPHGLSGDGPSFGTVTLQLAPGPHDVEVRVGDTINEEWTQEFVDTIVLESGRRTVVSFDPRHGVTLTE